MALRKTLSFLYFRLHRGEAEVLLREHKVGCVHLYHPCGLQMLCLYHQSLLCTSSVLSDLKSRSSLSKLDGTLWSLSEGGHKIFLRIPMMFTFRNLRFPMYFVSSVSLFVRSLNSILKKFLRYLFIISCLLIFKSRGLRCCLEVLSMWVWVVNCGFH